MSNLIDRVFGQKINGVRVVPLGLKIVAIFTVVLLISNFATNYINFVLGRGELLRQMNQLLVKDLKELTIFASNQFQVYGFNKDLPGAISSIEQSAAQELGGQKSVALGVRPDGSLLFLSSKTVRRTHFDDRAALDTFRRLQSSKSPEGSILFNLGSDRYIGMFKYNEDWGVFIVRAEELTEFYQPTWAIFRTIAYLIIGLTVLCILLGILLIRRMLRFVGFITKAIMDMQQRQSLDIINLAGAPNDEITFLGVALNSTTSTVDNLMGIFRKFVTRDLARKAYRERDIRLEGSRQELTILFSDIRGFTTMTEALGTDIIRLLNLHYDKAIRHIEDNGGVVGSIIGDALLAVYGTLEGYAQNKSTLALKSAYQVQEVAAALREEMGHRREEILRRQGALSAFDERIYRAVLLEVGVGIDGGEVFYGTLGSNDRMTNTVIGDNVNSASRLEGLTRLYKVPVIVSEYVRQEVKSQTDEYQFLELDRVQVKGKTGGKRIYWPIQKLTMDEALEHDCSLFVEGLARYYGGDWPEAYRRFARCHLAPAEIFRDRTRNAIPPKGWNGIWALETK